MKTRRSTIAAFTAVIALAVLAGCGPDSPKPTPSPTSKNYPFEVASQYVLDARLNSISGEHTERIVVTLGKPVSVQAYRANPKNALLCRNLQVTDTIVPMYTEVTNTSKAAVANVMIGNSMALSIDSGKLTHNFSVSIQDNGLQQCVNPLPLLGASTKPIGDAPDFLPYWESWSPPGKVVPLNGTMQALGLMALGSGGENPPPVEAFFLRMAPTDNKAHVHYTITALQAVNGQGGVVLEGADAGVYYLPLGKVSPCDTFAGAVKMKCGAKLP